MSVQDELDKLRQSVEGCDLVAYADIDAKIVLVSSSEKRASREVLDQLCEAASNMFAVGSEDLTDADIALAMSADRLHVYVRDQRELDDVVCCAAAPGTDPNDLIRAAQSVLSRLVTEAGGA